MRDNEDTEEDESYNYISNIVPEYDDPCTLTITFRSLFLGTLFNILLATCNSILAFRTSPFVIPSSVAVLLSYPFAIFLSKCIPKSFRLFSIELNPGPFTIKEHVIISIIASAGGGVAYGVDNVVVQKFSKFMGNSQVNLWNSLAFVMSVQLVGFGMAVRFKTG
jgi:uncharacterized oligopeptide transporter (OPT) family protein